MTTESVEIKELRKHEQSFSAFSVVMEYGASFPLPFRTGGDCRTSNNINLSMQFGKHGKHVNKEDIMKVRAHLFQQLSCFPWLYSVDRVFSCPPLLSMLIEPRVALT